MKEEITKRLIEYLYLETNYAIIINGNYGIGKTHYLKNELFPQVRKLKVPKSEKDEYFTPILVSLFGVKSIEDIQSQIFVELFPILKKKGIKIAAGLGNGILKYFNNDLKQLISDTGATGSFTDYRKVLICIDDIDRKGKELDIQEVFGFVNNLVENFGAKIVLIANEDELRNSSKPTKGSPQIKTQDSYSLLREKVIGVSVNFKTNLNSTFDEIIKSKYKKDFPGYLKFLQKNKKPIVKTIELNKDNLRSLLFFLEHFKIIFSGLQGYFDKDKSLENYKEEIFEKIISFSLPIAFEYKSGDLKPENFEEIRQLYINGYFDLSSFLNDGPQVQFQENQEKNKTYKEKFRDRYLEQKDQNILFDSIFNYIVGESAFNIDSLKGEINSAYKIEDEKIPRREIILRKLSYWDCVNLPYKEYRNLTKEMLVFTDNSAYGLEQYPTIFHFATRFENMLDYNLENLVKRLKKSIDQGNFQFQDSLHFHFSISTNSEYYEKLKEIGDYCLKRNKEIEAENEAKEISVLFDLMRTNFNEFLEALIDQNRKYRFSPVFLKLNFKAFWKEFKKLSNTDLVEFAFTIQRRYTRHIYPELLPEKEFLEKLDKKIDIKTDNPNTKKLDRISFEFVQNKIKESLQNFV